MADDVASHEKRLDSLRLENVGRCFAVLRDAGASTIGDLAMATGLSRPTVRDRLVDLVELGLVAESDRVFRRGQSSGRPASRYGIAPDAGFIIGVELGKHQERMLVCDVTGRVRARYTFAADHRQRVALRMHSLTTHVEELRERHADLGALLGLGAAVPGSLAPDGKMLVSPIFPEWAGQNIREVFESAFDVPVTLQNDLNAAAIAEHRHGAAVAVDDVVLALVWHQITAGIIVNGQLHSGSHSEAGGVSRLRSSAHQDLRTRWPSTPELLATVDAAEAGDAEAHALLERFADVAGEQIASVLLTIDPGVVVLYGPATVSDLLVELVTEAVIGAIVPRVEAPIVRAELGEDAAAFGALLAALDDVHRRVFGDPARPAHRLIDQTS